MFHLKQPCKYIKQKIRQQRTCSLSNIETHVLMGSQRTQNMYANDVVLESYRDSKLFSTFRNGYPYSSAYRKLVPYVKGSPMSYWMDAYSTDHIRLRALNITEEQFHIHERIGPPECIALDPTSDNLVHRDRYLPPNLRVFHNPVVRFVRTTFKQENPRRQPSYIREYEHDKSVIMRSALSSMTDKMMQLDTIRLRDIRDVQS